MKKCWLLVIVMLLLTGCGGENYETLGDSPLEPVSAPVKQILLQLPEDASSEVMTGEDGSKLYFCEDYTVSLQTRQGGDLDATLRDVTGYGRSALSVIQTKKGELKSYTCAWTAVGEGEDLIARTMVLDDGSYHYCLTVMAGASQAGELQDGWKTLFASFDLTDPSINTAV